MAPEEVGRAHADALDVVIVNKVPIRAAAIDCVGTALAG